MVDQPQHPAILASDSDRDRSVEQLSTAVSEGRLTLEEFGDRVGLAQVARTQDDLAVLTRDLPAVAPEPGVVPAHARHVAFCSRLVRRGPWELSPRTSFRCILGTVVLDLSEARLSGAETEVEIYNLFGTVSVIVPEEVQISVSGGGLFASRVIETPARSSVAGAPRLRINARGPGGTLYVRKPAQPPERLARPQGAGDP
jgi:Domain of unknown function (DUF1707)/Cell wall-active antibiotics response 4TMS YvqF